MRFPYPVVIIRFDPISMLFSFIHLEFSGDQNNTILLPSRYNPISVSFSCILLEFSGDQNNTILLPSRYNPVRSLFQCCSPVYFWNFLETRTTQFSYPVVITRFATYFNVVLLYTFRIFWRSEQHDSPTQLHAKPTIVLTVPVMLKVYE